MDHPADHASGLDAEPDKAPAARAYTIDEFCRMYRLSKATIFREWKSGRGPRVMRVGRRVLIPVSAVVEWQRHVETAAS